ncbi:hypothetical protein [Mesorhizobium sp. M0870]|uniref:hypothetical protein n=1 Tax=Mesorhizobium sp. M0870 TaxID=2957016 RepID=UPI00333A47EC
MTKAPASGVRPVYPDTHRTRITNGKDLLPGVDGRTFWVRRMRDVMALHVSDLGGVEACSEAEKSIIRRAAAITVEMERLERVFALAGDTGPDLDALSLYSRLANTLRRLLDMTDLQRRSRDITPTIDEYIHAVAQEAVA